MAVMARKPGRVARAILGVVENAEKRLARNRAACRREALFVRGLSEQRSRKRT